MRTLAFSSLGVSLFLTLTASTGRAAPSSYQVEVLADKPLLYYSFEETSGTVAQNSGTLAKSADGTYTPGPAKGDSGPRPPDFPGFNADNRCATFDGATDFVDTGLQLLQASKAFTIELWMVEPAAQGGNRIGFVGQNDAVEYGLINPTTVQIWTPGGGSLNTPWSFPPGQWHHVVSLGDGQELRTYYDGELQGSGGRQSDNYGESGFNVHIGGGGVYDASGNFFTGKLDEIAVYDRALSEDRIKAHYKAAFKTTGAPFVVISQDPQSATIATGKSVTLTVTSAGSSSPTYQWQKAAPGSASFADIAGATSSSYTTPTLAAADSGARFHVVVSIPTQSITSREAVVTVDTQPPTIASASGSGNFNAATIVFSEPVDAATAGNKANYSLDGGLTISSVKVANPTTVLLSTSKQTSGTKYTVTVNNVKDLVGNTLAANSKSTFTGFVLGLGALKFEVWFNIPGNPVDNLVSDPRFPDSPDDVGFVTAYDSRTIFPDDRHEMYGDRISGWLIPTETAQYELFLRSDDASQLFLSTDDNPANLTQIAEETGCCNPFQESGANQTSSPLNLVAGKRYYIQSLHKEGGGNDFTQVAWRKVGDTTAAGNLAPIPGKYLQTYLSPDGVSLDITQQPQNATVSANTRARFSVAAVGNSVAGTAVSYQWQKNGADISGATKPSYTTPVLTLADNGAKYRCVLYVPTLSKTSSEAVVTVVNDTTKPTLVSAQTYGQPDQVTVLFSEPVSASSVGSAKFTIDGGVSVTKATQAAAQDTVRLTTSALAAGKAYTLSVSGIKDLAGNDIAADSKIPLDVELHYPGAVLADKPILYLRFEEADVPTAENLGSLGSAANGKYMPNPQIGDAGPRPPDLPGFDVNNKAATFNGLTDFVGTENQLLQERKAFSIELWVKPDPFSATRVGLAGQNDAVEFGFIDPNTIQIWTPSGGSLSTGYRFPRGGWHHIVTIGTGTNLKTYFDGKLAGNGGTTITDNYGSSTFNVNIGGGGVFDGTGNFFTGQIDEVAIYDFALSEARIVAHYAAATTSTAQPTVAIASPADGAIFATGSSVALTATASAASGKTITKVEFFVGTTKLGEASSSPYTITVPKVAEGRYVVTARATDSQGLFKDSAPINVVIGSPPQTITLFTFDDSTVWRYNREGLDLGTAWKDPKYDDSKWEKGVAPIGDNSDRSEAVPIRTQISRFNNAGDHITTLYIRGHFNFPGNSTAGVTLSFKHMIDDGGVFYLNGMEISRFGIPAGPVTYDQFAADHEASTIEGPYVVPVSALTPGDNVFAAEIHQTSAGSSDIVFGAQLIATVPGGAPPPVTTGPKFSAPSVQGGNLVLTWSGTGTLQSADAVTGPWADVANAKSPLTVTRSGNAKFYRVKQ